MCAANIPPAPASVGLVQFHAPFDTKGVSLLASPCGQTLPRQGTRDLFLTQVAPVLLFRGEDLFLT